MSEFDIHAKLADTELAIARTQKAIDARPGTYALLLTRRAYHKRKADLEAVLAGKPFNLSSDPDIVVDTMAAFYHADIRELTEALSEALQEWSCSDYFDPGDPDYQRCTAIRDKHRKPDDEIGDKHE